MVSINIDTCVFLLLTTLAHGEIVTLSTDRDRIGYLVPINANISGAAESIQTYLLPPRTHTFDGSDPYGLVLGDAVNRHRSCDRPDLLSADICNVQDEVGQLLLLLIQQGISVPGVPADRSSTLDMREYGGGLFRNRGPVENPSPTSTPPLTHGSFWNTVCGDNSHIGAALCSLRSYLMTIQSTQASVNSSLQQAVTASAQAYSVAQEAKVAAASSVASLQQNMQAYLEKEIPNTINRTLYSAMSTSVKSVNNFTSADVLTLKGVIAALPANILASITMFFRNASRTNGTAQGNAATGTSRRKRSVEGTAFTAPYDHPVVDKWVHTARHYLGIPIIEEASLEPVLHRGRRETITDEVSGSVYSGRTVYELNDGATSPGERVLVVQNSMDIKYGLFTAVPIIMTLLLLVNLSVTLFPKWWRRRMRQLENVGFIKRIVLLAESYAKDAFEAYVLPDGCTGTPNAIKLARETPNAYSVVVRYEVKRTALLATDGSGVRGKTTGVMLRDVAIMWIQCKDMVVAQSLLTSVQKAPAATVRSHPMEFNRTLYGMSGDTSLDTAEKYHMVYSPDWVAEMIKATSPALFSNEDIKFNYLVPSDTLWYTTLVGSFLELEPQSIMICSCDKVAATLATPQAVAKHGATSVLRDAVHTGGYNDHPPGCNCQQCNAITGLHKLATVVDSSAPPIPAMAPTGLAQPSTFVPPTGLTFPGPHISAKDTGIATKVAGRSSLIRGLKNGPATLKSRIKAARPAVRRGKGPATATV